MERKAITTEALFEEFITDRVLKGCTQSSIMNYRVAYAHFRCKSTNELTKECYRAYLGVLVQSGLSISSINHYITHIRAFFYWAMSEGYCAEFKIQRMRGQEPTFKAYTKEEIQKLLVCNTKKCSYVEHRCYAIICFILATGSRANTIINIKTTDIIGEYVSITTQKNKKPSMIPLSQQCQRIIKDFRNAWNNDSEWLFSDRYGKQLTWTGLRLSMANYFAKRNVVYKGVHSLRHTFSREFIINGGNPAVLQRMLGHSTMEVTKRYIYLYSEDCKNAIQSVTPLDTMIIPKK